VRVSTHARSHSQGDVIFVPAFWLHCVVTGDKLAININAWSLGIVDDVWKAVRCMLLRVCVTRSLAQVRAWSSTATSAEKQEMVVPHVFVLTV
jgi:hypothetical protein